MSESNQGQRVESEQSRQSRRTRGVAVVEFAIVALLLFTLVFGIIGYSYMMSFRQALTQATAEASRAGAIAPAGLAQTRARDAINEALSPYGVTCSLGGSLLKASTSVGTCSIPAPAACTNNPSRQCITVTVEYQYRDHPLLPTFPGLGLAMPERVGFTSVAEVS